MAVCWGGFGGAESPQTGDMAATSPACGSLSQGTAPQPPEAPGREPWQEKGLGFSQPVPGSPSPLSLERSRCSLRSQAAAQSRCPWAVRSQQSPPGSKKVQRCFPAPQTVPQPHLRQEGRNGGGSPASAAAFPVLSPSSAPHAPGVRGRNGAAPFPFAGRSSAIEAPAVPAAVRPLQPGWARWAPAPGWGTSPCSSGSSILASGAGEPRSPAREPAAFL